jgi:2-polyprenyl-6-methoxyphenol hydroxylase-like FAD-dependent oxidoreductase
VRCDVVVVGGGPSGAICASMLSACGLRITLVVGHRPRRLWLELLSPEGVLFLRSLGCDPSRFTGSTRACPGIVDTWNRDAPTLSDFELTRCSAGWVVDRDEFDVGLVKFAGSLGVSVVRDGASYRLTSGTETNPVVLESRTTGSRIEAGFVVDASGTTGRLMPGTHSRRVWFDRLTAVRVFSRAVPANPEWMRLGSSSAGWWYTLPGFDGETQAVFMTDADLLADAGSAARHFLEQQFAEAFGCVPLFKTDVDGTGTEIRSARTSCRRTLWSHHWMPTGDAAYSIDPISGGGLARAFRMAEQTATATADFFSTRTFDGLQALAVERVREFCGRLELLRAYYARAAEEFPDSPFWHRRLPQRAKPNTGITGKEALQR